MTSPQPYNPLPPESLAVPQGRAFVGVIESIPALTQYLRIVQRWRWLILGAVVSVVVLGLIVTLLMRPLYTATTTIEIAREADNIVKVEGVERDAAPNDIEFYQTQYGVLKSQSMSEDVASTLKLADDPAFFEMYGVKLAPKNGVKMANGKFARAGYDDRLRSAGAILRKNLKVAPIASSRLVDIKLTSPNARFSATVANSWAERFINSNLQRKMDRTAYARKFLEVRLEQLRVKLEESERALVGNAADQQIITFSTVGAGVDAKTQSGDRSIATADLEQFNVALAQATAERMRAAADLQRGRQSPELTQNPAIGALRAKRAEAAAEHARLMGQFEPGYPAARALQLQIAQLDKAIAGEEARVLNNARSGLEGVYRAAVARESSLQARVAELKGAVIDQRRKGIQYNIYQREVDTNRQIYDALLQRYKEIGVTGGVGSNNVSVVDKARVPLTPSSPNLWLNMALSVLAGLGVAALLTFGLEQVDETISDLSRLERDLGIAALGAIPLSSSEDMVAEVNDVKSTLVEAYLSLQTSLEFSTSHGFPRSLCLTSTRAGEGKSTSSFALAMLLARSKRKVILIDGDLRSPSVHHMMDTKNVRGVSNYLVGVEDVTSLISTKDGNPLHYMAAGPIPPNAAELLNGPRMGQLVETLLQHYDHVIVDAPPVLGLADALLISRAVEGVVYVISSHSSKVSMIKLALARMNGVGAHIFGAVITKFDEKRAYYGYGYDYSYNYGTPKSLTDNG